MALVQSDGSDHDRKVVRGPIAVRCSCPRHACVNVAQGMTVRRMFEELKGLDAHPLLSLAGFQRRSDDSICSTLRRLWFRRPHPCWSSTWTGR